MSQRLPFGNDTLVIPFTFVPQPGRRRSYGMSRMRPAAELFRYGVRRPDDDAGWTDPAPRLVPVSDEIPDAQKPPSERIEDDARRQLENSERGLTGRTAHLPDGDEVFRPIPTPGPSGRSGSAGPSGGAGIPLGAGGNADDPATETQRRDLRRNLGLAPNDPRQAHHIVPGGGPMNGGRDPTRAQDWLSQFGIGLETLDNGVPLSADFHRRLHSTAYYAYINDELGSATSVEEATKILQKIRSRLIREDQLYQMTGMMPNWR